MKVPTFSGQLAALGTGPDEILERVHVPAYLIDTEGRIRWLNAAARDLVGDANGRPFMDVVVPQDRQRATAAFREKILGQKWATDLRLEVRTRSGASLPVEISSIAVHGGRQHRIVGVFGLAAPRWSEPSGTRRHPHLTPWQRETLTLLGEGASTDVIAERLGVARETARNHIRSVLRELGVRSRLEAVVEAHARGLL